METEVYSFMISFPPCKINLGLQIIRKRPDGYHDLVTCYYPVPWSDILEIIPGNNLSFSSSGNSIPGEQDDNLCLKAYRLLKKDFSLPDVSIHLHKIIPTGAGLGGGSSDAAHTLRLLNTVFELNLSVNQLQRYASMIGSDCAFFVQDAPKLGSGKGEILQDVSVSLAGKFLVLIKPDIHISTAEAYASVKAAQPMYELQDILKEPITAWKDKLKNDFEISVFQKYPKINEIKKKLYQFGAIYASMSGSGSAVYGIFQSEIDLKKEFRKCEYWAGTLPPLASLP